MEPTDQRWLEFIASQEQSTIFHHPAWINLIAESYMYTPFVLAAVNKQGNIEAGVPFMKVKTALNKKRWVSLPYTDHCAPLYNSPEALEFLTARLIDFSRDEKIKNLELRWAYPYHPEIQSRSAFVLTRSCLKGGEQKVASRIKRKHFREINAACQRGVRIEWGTDDAHLSTFYNLHLQTRRRLGVPVQPWSFFKRLGDSITKRGKGFLVSAYKEKLCVASAIFLHWNRTLCYKYSASIEEARHLRAMDPILWEAIRWACKREFHWLDMGRTDQDNLGLRSFKRRWGSEEFPLAYSVSPPQSSRYLQNRLAPFMQLFIRKSPLWVCKLTGELFYRYFG